MKIFCFKCTFSLLRQRANAPIRRICKYQKERRTVYTKTETGWGAGISNKRKLLKVEKFQLATFLVSISNTPKCVLIKTLVLRFFIFENYFSLLAQKQIR